MLGVHVVKAFNNIVVASLATRGAVAGTPGAFASPSPGDDPHADEPVLGLIDTLNVDGIDAGTLADSWRQRLGTPVYCRDLDMDPA